MAQEFVYPKSESELRTIQDEFYRISKDAVTNRVRPSFRGLIEIISSETVVLTAIHNIKANKGSETAGTDGRMMREHILEQDYEVIINLVRTKLLDKDFIPEQIRRVWIPKEGKKEKRPLGIPSIIDRILQECIRIVIEPIFEAQFFNHSYGFRPMRESCMALGRVTYLVHNTGYHWIVEGDISKYFDTVHHNTLLKRMKFMGIHDSRLLMIIKKFLKAGILNEVKQNPIGTPQGGILSPLLANIYLDSFDQWIFRQWEGKTTSHDYSWCNRYRALRGTDLHPAYLVRYADDWVLITNSREHAIAWKRRINSFLQEKLKLKLSEEKTVITNVRKKNIKFLGYEYKLTKGKSRTGYIPKTMPNRDRVKRKIKSILKHTQRLSKSNTFEIIHNINLVNSMIRGLINYYESTTLVCVILSKYSYTLNWAGIWALKRFGVDWLPANKVNNLTSVHSDYETKLPTITVNELKIGITNIGFCKFRKIDPKNQQETPYTQIGRKLHFERTNKKPLKVRADELLSLHTSKLIAEGKKGRLYNFEFYLNRAYVFNRDRGKCKICRDDLHNYDVHIHHIHPLFPLNEVNRVKNLACMHEDCHRMIHSNADYSYLNATVWKRIKDFREKLKLIL